MCFGGLVERTASAYESGSVVEVAVVVRWWAVVLAALLVMGVAACEFEVCIDCDVLLEFGSGGKSVFNGALDGGEVVVVEGGRMLTSVVGGGGGGGLSLITILGVSGTVGAWAVGDRMLPSPHVVMVTRVIGDLFGDKMGSE